MLTVRCRFSSCYDQASTQEEIFEKDVRPLIDVVFQGSVSPWNDSTYASRTLTRLPPRLSPYSRMVSRLRERHTLCREHGPTLESFPVQYRYVTGRIHVPDDAKNAFETLFNQAEAVPNAKVTVSVSYMEIYRDEVYDLLVQRDTVSQMDVALNPLMVVY